MYDKTMFNFVFVLLILNFLLCLRLYEFLFSACNSSANLSCGLETMFENNFSHNIVGLLYKISRSALSKFPV